MPKKSRIDTIGALHHIMVRGIEGCKVFRNDIDRDNFLEGTEIWDVLQNINPKNIKDQPDKNFRYLAHWNEYLFVM